MNPSIYNICSSVVNLLEQHRYDLNIQKVYYGDQAKLFARTAICVEPGTKKVSMRSANRKAECVFNVSVFVYVGTLKAPINDRKSVDIITDKVAAILNDSINLDGLVTDCYVESITHGYSTKADGIVQANEISLRTFYLEQLRNSI